MRNIKISQELYIYIPRTQLTSIFEGQPFKTRPFSIKTRVIWVLGIYIYIDGIWICWIEVCFIMVALAPTCFFPILAFVH